MLLYESMCTTQNYSFIGIRIYAHTERNEIHTHPHQQQQHKHNKGRMQIKKRFPQMRFLKFGRRHLSKIPLLSYFFKKCKYLLWQFLKILIFMDLAIFGEWFLCHSVCIENINNDIFSASFRCINSISSTMKTTKNINICFSI